MMRSVLMEKEWIYKEQSSSLEVAHGLSNFQEGNSQKGMTFPQDLAQK
jgi:hypothetical protein